MKKPSKAELKITAFHEAGHAVACRHFEVLHDTIFIVRGEGRDGSIPVEGDNGFMVPCGTDPFSEQNERAFQAWAEQQAIIDYAGHAAVVALLRIGDMSRASAESLGAASDYDKAHERLGGSEARLHSIQNALWKSSPTDAKRLRRSPAR
jgi:hypothetical protein